MSAVKRVLAVLGFTGTTVPAGYTPVKEGRVEVTIGSDVAQVPMVHLVDGAGDSLQPLTDAQLRAAAVPVSMAALPGFAQAPTVNLGTLNGAATEATLLALKNSVQAQISISGTVWTDDSGAYYVRRDTVTQNGIQVTFTSGASGAEVTPGAGLRPVDAVDAEVVQTVYDAVTAGAGYAAGDVLISVSIINTSAAVPSAAFMWINRTAQAAMTAAPVMAHLVEHKQAVSIAGSVAVTMANAPTGAATDATLAAINTTLAQINLNLVRQNLMFASLTGQSHLIDSSISSI